MKSVKPELVAMLLQESTKFIGYLGRLRRHEPVPQQAAQESLKEAFARIYTTPTPAEKAKIPLSTPEPTESGDNGDMSELKRLKGKAAERAMQLVEQKWEEEHAKRS